MSRECSRCSRCSGRLRAPGFCRRAVGTGSRPGPVDHPRRELPWPWTLILPNAIPPAQAGVDCGPERQPGRSATVRFAGDRGKQTGGTTAGCGGAAVSPGRPAPWRSVSATTWTVVSRSGRPCSGVRRYLWARYSSARCHPSDAQERRVRSDAVEACGAPGFADRRAHALITGVGSAASGTRAAPACPRTCVDEGDCLTPTARPSARSPLGFPRTTQSQSFARSGAAGRLGFARWWRLCALLRMDEAITSLPWPDY
jgi:hypothetical protein